MKSCFFFINWYHHRVVVQELGLWTAYPESKCCIIVFFRNYFLSPCWFCFSTSYFPKQCLFFVYLTDILIMYQIVICCSENRLKVEWVTLKYLDFIKTYNVIFSELRLPFNDHIYHIRGNLLLWRSQLSGALPSSWEIIHVKITIPLRIKRISFLF